MNEQYLQEAWKGATGESKKQDALKNMLLESKHPVLKRIRRQALWEGICFTVFLLAYYDLFDGNAKPLYANLLLVAGVVLVVLHHVWGYLVTKRRIGGANVSTSLQSFARAVRLLGITSVICRLLAVTCILLFFVSVITFTATKYWMLAGAVLVALVQLVLLAVMWLNRIKAIQSAVNGLV